MEVCSALYFNESIFLKKTQILSDVNVVREYISSANINRRKPLHVNIQMLTSMICEIKKSLVNVHLYQMNKIIPGFFFFWISWTNFCFGFPGYNYIFTKS